MKAVVEQKKYATLNKPSFFQSGSGIGPVSFRFSRPTVLITSSRNFNKNYKKTSTVALRQEKRRWIRPSVIQAAAASVASAK